MPIAAVFKVLAQIPGALVKDRVLAALVLTLVAALAVTLAKPGGGELFGNPGIGEQRWGCPAGHIEYEKGCFNPKTKTYMPGKKIVSS
jgi:hypothetical protein